MRLYRSIHDAVRGEAEIRRQIDAAYARGSLHVLIAWLVGTAINLVLRFA